MDQLIDITRVVVGTQYLTATVRIADDAPLMTSEDLEGTTRVYNLLPTIIDHACVGDAGSIFKDCMGDTELAHLLEHVTIELLARTNLVDEIISGRTWRELAYDRMYSIQLPCVDDVLVAGALSSAVWIISWAFNGGAGPVPDVDATVAGLVSLVQSLPDPSAQDSVQEQNDRGYEDDEPYYEDYFDEYLDSSYENEESDENGEELDRGPRMSQKII
ncbi:MAG: hypothetical protein Q4B54_00980 [Coriobacteriales bacterium]|nr:hypothetical protein [Coriobacteriales bacterium]